MGCPLRRSPWARPSASATASSANCSLPAGIYLNITNRRPEAAAYYRESARLADQVGDSRRLGMALLNLADIVVATDPGTAAETARAAAGHLRRAGYRAALAVAIVNLGQALMMLGDWDTAEAELAQAADSDALAGYELLTCYGAWLAALRGDAAAAQTALADLTDLRASEDPQDTAMISMVEGFTAAARHQPQDALRHARAALAHADALADQPRLRCAGRGRWPPAPPTNCATPPPPASCSPCSPPPRPGTCPRCCGPNAT